jgi:hypothetical protein
MVAALAAWLAAAWGDDLAGTLAAELAVLSVASMVDVMDGLTAAATAGVLASTTVVSTVLTKAVETVHERVVKRVKILAVSMADEKAATWEAMWAGRTVEPTAQRMVDLTVDPMGQSTAVTMVAPTAAMMDTAKAARKVGNSAVW